MDNYFDNEIKQLQKEIINLKTSGTKSAEIVETISQTIPISMQLSLGQSSTPPGAVAQKYFEIETDDNALVMITLDHYYDDINEAWQVLPKVTARYFDMTRFEFQNGNIGVRLIAYGTNTGADNDAEKISGGQVVTMSCNMTVRCTTNFSLREV